MIATVHPTADVSPLATLGAGTRVWHQAHIREGAVLGAECVVGKGVYVDNNVVIGERCKLQNGSMVFHGATLGSGVFVGPGAILTNDRQPRAITPDGALKGGADWTVGTIVVEDGASIGAGAIVVAGVRIGRFAMVAAGAVVVGDVPSFGLAVGVPARLIGFVCRCGASLPRNETTGPDTDIARDLSCAVCGRAYVVAGTRCSERHA